MKEKILEWMFKSTATGHYLRIFAGLYVVYLGIKSAYDELSAEMTDIILVILSALLSLAGIIIIAVSIYALITHNYCESKPYDDGTGSRK